MTARPIVRLKPKADARRLRRGYPWVYANELVLDRRTRTLAPGTVAELHDGERQPVATVAFNPGSRITARMLDADPAAAIDVAWLERRIGAALAHRQKLYPTPHYRLVHAEADGLPGVVIDRFGDVAVLQPNAAWAEAMLEPLVAALVRVTGVGTVVKNAQGRTRGLEGLDDASEVLRGALDGPVAVPMNGATYFADLLGGQKTGLFFDQRANHAFAARLGEGGRMLDVFSHVGGFALAALAAGADEALAVDGSAPALELAQRGAAERGTCRAADDPPRRRLRGDGCACAAKARVSSSSSATRRRSPRTAVRSRRACAPTRGWRGSPRRWWRRADTSCSAPAPTRPTWRSSARPRRAASGARAGTRRSSGPALRGPTTRSTPRWPKAATSRRSSAPSAVRALLDTCVLYPTVLREMLLGVADAELFAPLWSPRILEEWRHVAARRGDEAVAGAEIALLEARWPDAAVTARAADEDRLWLPDPGDVHVLGAAIAGGAEVLVTLNVADFPRAALAAHDIALRHPDHFLLERLAQDPDAVAAVAERVRAKAEELSGTPQPMRPLMKRARLPRFARALERL